MTTVALSTTPATLDPGTAYDLDVVNSGSTIVHVQIAGGLLFDQRINPGQTIKVHPGGQAVTAFARSGSGQVTTTAYTNPEVAGGSGAYQPVSSAPVTIAYNASNQPVTVTETASGAVTTYTYNADGTPATESRVLGGVTTLRTFTYTSGNLTAVA